MRGPPSAGEGPARRTSVPLVARPARTVLARAVLGAGSWADRSLRRSSGRCSSWPTRCRIERRPPPGRTGRRCCPGSAAVVAARVRALVL